MATADRAEYMDKLKIQLADTSIEIEEIEVGLPDMPNFTDAPPGKNQSAIECRTTGTASPDNGMAAGSLVSKAASPDADLGAPAPLHIPDLSLDPGISGPAADFSLPGEHADAEIIEITADANPHTAVDHHTARYDTTAGSTDAITGQPSKENTEVAYCDNPSIQTVNIRTVRPGLLRRLLTGIQSLFTSSREPE
jgi:hypothetical protein